jgi:UDP-hydrolysing UDP-N-acetyl-D-glucosamine 2-epimerase
LPERRIAVLTTGRQDYGILRSTVHALLAHPVWHPRVWAGAMHCDARFGRTADLVRADGVPVHRELVTLEAERDPAAEAARMLTAVSAAIADERPEALLLVGDRTETAAAGLAAAIMGVPIVHVHGGEESEGAVDNALRHALTKLAHLHLVSHELHAERVRQMGEPGETVIVVGPPGVDNMHRDDLATRAELEAALGGALRAPVLVVTHHPATLGDDPAAEAAEIAAALEGHSGTIVVTMPNSDAGADAIRAVWQRLAAGPADVRCVEALGERRYWGLLRLADAVLGNSSSGVIEAPAAGVPSLTIGDRQAGRLMPAGVLHVPAESEAIRAALHAVLRAERSFDADVPPYPTGPVAPRIITALEGWTPPQPARKRFERMPCAISC